MRWWHHTIAAAVIAKGAAVFGQGPVMTLPEPKAGEIAVVDRGTFAKAEAPIDLATALRLAHVENPELLLARERVVEATALRQLAVAQILPNLNIGSNYDLHRGAASSQPGTSSTSIATLSMSASAPMLSARGPSTSLVSTTTSTSARRGTVISPAVSES